MVVYRTKEWLFISDSLRRISSRLKNENRIAKNKGIHGLSKSYPRGRATKCMNLENFIICSHVLHCPEDIQLWKLLRVRQICICLWFLRNFVMYIFLRNHAAVFRKYHSFAYVMLSDNEMLNNAFVCYKAKAKFAIFRWMWNISRALTDCRYLCKEHKTRGMRTILECQSFLI